jgi:hypothetical protein
MSDQPASFPDDNTPDAKQSDAVPTPEELFPEGDKDEDAGESPEVRQMEAEALSHRSQPAGKTAKIGSWIILGVLGLCLLGGLVVIVARLLR